MKLHMVERHYLYRVLVETQLWKIWWVHETLINVFLWLVLYKSKCGNPQDWKLLILFWSGVTLWNIMTSDEIPVIVYKIWNCWFCFGQESCYEILWPLMKYRLLSIKFETADFVLVRSHVMKYYDFYLDTAYCL
jgi:hypothetical protein